MVIFMEKELLTAPMDSESQRLQLKRWCKTHRQPSVWGQGKLDSTYLERDLKLAYPA